VEVDARVGGRRVSVGVGMVVAEPPAGIAQAEKRTGISRKREMCFFMAGSLAHVVYQTSGNLWKNFTAKTLSWRYLFPIT
jgi:hypothetical protein